MVENIQRRLKFIKENRNEMKQSEKVDIVESLGKQCEKVDSYIETMLFGIDKEDFFTVVDDDDAADGAAAAAPVVLPPLFEEPNQDKAPYMGCSMDPVCRRQGRAHLKAFCVFCNERGHLNCMVEVEGGIILHNSQDPAKEAGKAVRKLKRIAMVCMICDKHYGRFNRLYLEVAQMLHILKPKKSKDDDTVSNFSIFANPVACVAIKADGSSTTNKRKRPTDEEGKEDDE
jgi:hypothetical protein